ncbi:MAG: hypothetical protein KDA69_00700, partial [Planctomycetaceae bacterium]|nr:hypothetical protein [Planctomycetaceae bacterium]
RLSRAGIDQWVIPSPFHRLNHESAVSLWHHVCKVFMDDGLFETEKWTPHGPPYIDRIVVPKFSDQEGWFPAADANQSFILWERIGEPNSWRIIECRNEFSFPLDMGFSEWLYNSLSNKLVESISNADRDGDVLTEGASSDFPTFQCERKTGRHKLVEDFATEIGTTALPIDMIAETVAVSTTAELVPKQEGFAHGRQVLLPSEFEALLALVGEHQMHVPSQNITVQLLDLICGRRQRTAEFIVAYMDEISQADEQVDVDTNSLVQLPKFPAPGGLLPIGILDGRYLFYLCNGAPSEWTIVVANPPRIQFYDMPLSEWLVRLARGELQIP